MTKLNDKQLENVAGGSSRERTVVVTVDYSSDKKFDGDVEIKVYLDGELLPNQTRVISSSVTKFNIQVSGSGYATLKVKINNDIIKQYTINFDEGSYFEG